MTDSNSRTLPSDVFEKLGGGQIAYIRPVMSEEASRLFPQVPELSPGLKLWALLNADGSPILLTDSHAAALAGASQHDLVTVSVH